MKIKKANRYLKKKIKHVIKAFSLSFNRKYTNLDLKYINPRIYPNLIKKSKQRGNIYPSEPPIRNTKRIK